MAVGKNWRCGRGLHSVCGYVAIHTMVNFSYRFCKLMFFFTSQDHIGLEISCFHFFQNSLTTKIKMAATKIKIDKITFIQTQVSSI